MKGLSWFDKIVFAINTVFVFLLLIACGVPYISSENFSFLSFLSLAVPFLVGSNFMFLLYWVIRKKRQLWLSLFVLVFGYFVLGTFVKFKFSKDKVLEEDLTVMSYNVRGFNRFGGLDNPRVFEDVQKLIDKENSDIICFQEFNRRRRDDFGQYEYYYSNYTKGLRKSTQAVLSKYPIISQGSLYFPDTANEAIYVDIVYKIDTIRLYNVHLESYKITPRASIVNESFGRLYKKLNKSFQKQGQQSDIFNKHRNSSPYKVLVCGDFNSTQFSNVYQVVKGDMEDTFIAKGSGYGKTYNFLGAPLRIDFILADEAFEIKSHKNYDEKLSDHFPIMASFSMKSE